MPNTTPQSTNGSLKPTEADYAYIGRHMTESINTIPHHWQKLLWHLFRQASEQEGSEFAERLCNAFVRGTPNRRGLIRREYKTATAAVRAKEHRKRQREAVDSQSLSGSTEPDFIPREPVQLPAPKLPEHAVPGF